MGAVLDLLPPYKLYCPQCSKRYVTAEWKKSPRCRQCNIELRPVTPPKKVASKAQTA